MALMVKELVRRALPRTAYGMGRRLAKRVRRRERLEPIEEEALAGIVRDELGLREGDLAMVHSSVDALGLGFPFVRLLPLLRRIVGAEGTLLFPATHLVERPERWFERDEVFDVRRTPTAMGLLSEMARRQSDAARSLHPTHSVVAVGPLAGELVATHHCDPYPCGQKSPYSQVAERGGLILGLGVDVDVLTSVHCVEDMGRVAFPVDTHRERLYEGRVRSEAGQEHTVSTLVAHPRIRWRSMRPFFKRHISDSVCHRLEVGGRSFYRADAAALLERMERLAERGVTMYRNCIYRGHFLEPLLSRWAEKLEER